MVVMQSGERLPSTLNKTASKLTDNELKKEKKPRVPKTRRPRLKTEKKEPKTLKSLQKKECTYDPCSIKIYKEDYTHLDDCLINNVLQDYNNFVSLTFKNKGGEYDFGNIKRLAKRFGIVINQKALQEEVCWLRLMYIGWVQGQSNHSTDQGETSQLSLEDT